MNTGRFSGQIYPYHIEEIKRL